MARTAQLSNNTSSGGGIETVSLCRDRKKGWKIVYRFASGYLIKYSTDQCAAATYLQPRFVFGVNLVKLGSWLVKYREKNALDSASFAGKMVRTEVPLLTKTPQW